MIATNELRRMLDERGIEYEQERTEGIASYTHVTKWNTQDGKRCYYHEIEDGERPYYTNLYVEFNNQPTPEQAIAATEEREATPTDELIRSMRQTISCEREAYEMLSRTYDAARDHILYQKEQLAETRSKLEDYKRDRTCHNTSEFSNAFECSECGFGYDFVTDPYQGPHYCPNCGRRVEQNI